MRVALLFLGLVVLPAIVLAGKHHHHHHDAAPTAAPTVDIVDASNVDAMFGLSAEDAMTSQFAEFKLQYGRVYESDAHEAHRFVIFKANMVRAAELQKLNPEATFGVNAFSDIHPVEFKKQYLNFNPAVGDAAVIREAASTRHASRKEMAAQPAAYDWRNPDQGRPVAVTAVKDQGQCGSCWAFSATEEVESAWILAGNTAVALAPEQTVDCDTVDQGCNGGDTVSAYAYMEGVGIEAEATYPYTAGNTGTASTCAYNASAVVAKISGFTYATPNCNDTCTHQDEKTLAANLYSQGPVSICVDASTWQTYTSGILTPASGCQSAYTALDHCVQLVGYGSDAGTDFWSVRNSWNTNWGEAGYIRISRGVNACGVADEATLVQL